jgi:hypothetical protein
MRTRRAARFASMLIIFCLAPAVFAQGLYWESVTGGGPLGDTQRLAKLYAMPKKLRQEEASGEVMIIRLDKQEVYMIKPAEKTYSVMTFAEIEEGMKKMGEQVNSKMAEMREKMKDMPEERRKMMEKMMGNFVGAGKDETPVNVKGPEGHKSILGYECKEYVVSRGENELMTLWVTNDIHGMDAMKKDWKEFAQRMTEMVPGHANALAEAFRKIDGFPMETDFGGTKTLVTKVEKRTTPSSAFEIPEGYTKTESPMQKMEHRDR